MTRHDDDLDRTQVDPIAGVLADEDEAELPQAVVGADPDGPAGGDGGGGYALQFCVGRGSMGDVFEAVDRLLGARVAVKVLSPARLDARRRDLFRREIEAVARLDHPGIVKVYDHGLVPDTDGVRAMGLAAGAPWFAMELVDGATLDELRVTRWGQLRGILLEILDALAHCHARGIIHCDLKPSNVLVAEPGRARGLKLSDFGIFVVDSARAPRRDTDVQHSNVGGTPRYMSPEQLRAQRHEIGPQTDLYALGCVAWRLCADQPPFASRDLEALVAQHLHDEPPALTPTFPAPRGLEAWLRKLLAKEPRARFASAADARAALLAIGQHDTGRHPSWPAPSLPEHWTDAHGTSDPDAPDLDAPDGRGAISPLLRGLGLRLFGVREVPFVGRSVERESLWQLLRQVHATGQTRVAVLRGALGMGKSRLATTLVERALTLGSARVVTCSHGPMPAPGDGLEAMVARLLRSHGLGRGEIAARINLMLGRDHDVPVPRLIDWMRADRGAGEDSGDEAPRVVRFSGLHERHLLLARFLRALALQDRPLIVHIDDAQWGEASLAFVRHVLESQAMRGVDDRLAALFVITVDDELLEGRDPARAALEAIERDVATTTLRLGPLDDAEQRALVDGLLHLEPALVERVIAGGGGRPQFSVLLVDDWVHRGVLRATAAGVTLSDPSAADELPADIEALWQLQLEGALASFPLDAGRGPLEVAAALGLRVDTRDWREACLQAGWTPADGLVDTLVGWRLVRHMPDGWAFAHPAVREAVERGARDAARWTSVHVACARMLDARGGVALAYGERIGRHLVAAGSGARALLPLLRGAEHRRRMGDLEGALGLLDLRDAVLDRESWHLLPARVHGISLRARILATLSRMDEAVEVLDRIRLLEAGEQRLEPWWLAHIAYVRSLVEFKLGHFDVARGHVDEALARYMALDDAVGITETRILLAKIVRMLDLARSVPLIEAALDAARRAQDALHYARAMMSLGEVHVRLGQREQGRRELERALELFEEIGNPERVAAVLNDLGEVARFDGDLELAERFYRRARQNMVAARSRDAAIPQLNLGLVLIALDRLDDARTVLEDVAASLEQARRPIYLLATFINLAHIAAVQQDWPRAAHHLDAFEAIFADTPIRDIDIARPARHVVRLATAAGQTTVQRRAEAIVRAQ